MDNLSSFSKFGYWISGSLPQIPVYGVEPTQLGNVPDLTQNILRMNERILADFNASLIAPVVGVPVEPGQPLPPAPSADTSLAFFLGPDGSYISVTGFDTVVPSAPVISPMIPASVIPANNVVLPTATEVK